MYAKPSDKQSAVAGSSFDFEFTLESKHARVAFLVANFSTWHVNQTLQVTLTSGGGGGGMQTGAAMQVPVHLTFGYWNQTRPVEVHLAEGATVFRFDRGSSDRGIAIKDFTCMPPGQLYTCSYYVYPHT